MSEIAHLIEVLWEDSHGLAVNKPAGLLTQTARVGDPELTLEALIRQYLPDAAATPAYLGTIHRLDRPVSGVVLWAKTAKVARRWADQFAHRQARKTYWAIVESTASNALHPSATWTDWLLKPDRSGQAWVVPPGTKGASLASTRIESGLEPDLVSGDRRYAWVRLYPETGRTHQLRAQTAARGWPIVGDTTYGAPTKFPAGIALHARRLEVEHPIRRDLLAVEAPLPPAWRLWLEAFAAKPSWFSQT